MVIYITHQCTEDRITISKDTKIQNKLILFPTIFYLWPLKVLFYYHFKTGKKHLKPINMTQHSIVSLCKRMHTKLFCKHLWGKLHYLECIWFPKDVIKIRPKTVRCFARGCYATRWTRRTQNGKHEWDYEEQDSQLTLKAISF